MRLNVLLTNNSFATSFNTPIFAPILDSRPTCLMIAGSAVLHIGLSAAGLPGWECPIRHTLGIPCPGCGLSRAMTAFVQGDWQASVTYHVFAPFFLLGIALIVVSLIVPETIRKRVIQWISRIEQETGLMAILLFGLVVYWAARLLLLGEPFITLINSG